MLFSIPHYENDVAWVKSQEMHPGNEVSQPLTCKLHEVAFGYPYQVTCDTFSPHTYDLLR